MNFLVGADNPKITIEDFEKFKETCNEEAAKARSERGKQLQAKNMGNHRLRSRTSILRPLAGRVSHHYVHGPVERSVPLVGEPPPWKLWLHGKEACVG